MSSKDFIDDDLIQRRDAVRQVKMGLAAKGVVASDVPRAEPVLGGDLNLTPLTRRKEEISGQVATKLEELELLRAKQQALEHEKSSLENLRNSQEKYEAGKREMIDRLEQSLIALEREEIALNQRSELLAETERRFKEMLNEMRGFNEEQWAADSEGLRADLGKALVVIENARKEYNKASARLEAGREGQNGGLTAGSALTDELAALARAPHRFGEWAKAGLAFSLPLIIVILVLAAVWFLRLN
ncbi:MAG: hypothetical protein HYV35_04745 [Lentisphaerae bacterium]|nr:hypothetical protein [Lentisphaerota bacterium]